MLNDPKYTQKAEEHGSLVMDQMSKPMERAVWWIEYAIRHPGGMKHMRSPVHQLHWSQYFLLDVYAFLAFSGLCPHSNAAWALQMLMQPVLPKGQTKAG